jgi:hypothetical protein
MKLVESVAHVVVMTKIMQYQIQYARIATAQDFLNRTSMITECQQNILAILAEDIFLAAFQAVIQRLVIG